MDKGRLVFTEHQRHKVVTIYLTFNVDKCSITLLSYTEEDETVDIAF